MKTCLDLFSGIGGFALACRWAGIETIAFCETNEDCAAFLERTWGRPVQRDIRTLNGKQYQGIYLLTGGPPCQPASRAGQQRGSEDDRWLWGEAVRIAKESQPTWFLFENPPGILDVGLDRILADLEGIGYEVQPVSIPACAVDSPQDRERIWILGYRKERIGRLPNKQWEGDSQSSGTTKGDSLADGDLSERWPDIEYGGSNLQGKHNQGEAPGGFESSAEIGDLASTRERGHREGAFKCSGQNCGWPCDPSCGPTENLPWQEYFWIVCPGDKVRRCPVGIHEMVDGVSTSLLQALGNSIVPAVAFQILKAMLAAERMNEK